MRKAVLLLAFVAASLLGASGVASAEPELGPGCGTPGVDQGRTATSKYGVVFTANKSGVMPKLWIGAAAPWDDFTIRVVTVDARGVPTDNVLASYPVSTVEFSGQPLSTWATFDDGLGSAAPEVVAGETYAIVVESSDPLGDVYWEMPGYASPDFCPDTSSYWWYMGGGEGGPLDLAFQTYIDPFDTAAPTGSVAINGDRLRTASRAVTLKLNAADPSPSSGLDSMRLKNAGGSWTAWQPYAASKDWKLTRGAGKKTVYAQYRDADGHVSAEASDSITYRP